jgi:hypothetical protein
MTLLTDMVFFSCGGDDSRKTRETQRIEEVRASESNGAKEETERTKNNTETEFAKTRGGSVLWHPRPPVF